MYRTEAIPEAVPATNPPKAKKKKKTHQKHIPTAVVMDGWTYPAEGGGFINRDYSQVATLTILVAAFGPDKTHSFGGAGGNARSFYAFCFERAQS